MVSTQFYDNWGDAGRAPRRLDVICKVPERPIYERPQIPAIEVLIGCLTGGVMTTGQDLGDEIDAVMLKVRQHVQRELAQECEVVGRVDDENTLWIRSKPLHIDHWANAQEHLSDLALRKPCLFKSGADVPCTLPSPCNISKPGRRMVEGADSQAGIMSGCDKGIAGPQARSKNAELRIAQGLKPVKTAADVYDSLPACGNGASYVCADGVV